MRSKSLRLCLSIEEWYAALNREWCNSYFSNKSSNQSITRRFCSVEISPVLKRVVMVSFLSRVFRMIAALYLPLEKKAVT